MDLLKDIGNFRSQALMSRYQNAILLGSKILNQIKLFSSTFHYDFTNIESQIKQEIKICSQISNFLKPKQFEKQINPTIQCKISKSWLKPSVNEKKALQRGTHQQNTQQKCSLSSYINQEPYKQCSHILSIQQQLHKRLILPLNMPLFKLKQTLILISASNCIGQVIQYLVDYDFYIIKEYFRVEDLGIQNIANIKQQIIKTKYNKAIIIYENNNQLNIKQHAKQNIEQHTKHHIEQKQNLIQRLTKTVRQYRQFYQQSQQQKQIILIFIIDNLLNKTIPNSQVPLKSIDFL